MTVWADLRASGLTGSATPPGVRVIDSSGTEIVARTTSITEFETSGLYYANITIPADPGEVCLVAWDIGVEDPGSWATEYYVAP